jgi:AcrR family transcriptional regulator
VPRPKERTPALRDHVLRTAVATLAAEGVAGFTARRVAEDAATSVPAVYELFGDKAGLVREVFFEGFRQLSLTFGDVPRTNDPRADLVHTIESLRLFVRANPELAQVMFSRPFRDFDPGPDELRGSASVREHLVGQVRRCVEAGLIAGDETDIAHVLLAVAQGLCLQETAGWLGSTRTSMDRRWALALRAALDGLAPGQS